MLVPHRREDAELGERRLTPDQGKNALVLGRREAMLGDELRRDPGFAGHGRLPLSGAGLSDGSTGSNMQVGRVGGSRHAARAKWETSPANKPRPSLEPIASST